jgi:hypothetical protein
MRVVTWNCKGGFKRKHPVIASLCPDVLILPEAERLENVSQVPGAPTVRSIEWIGSNRNKGLGVVSYGAFSLAVHEHYDPSIEWILPLRVSGPEPFTLIAVWTVPDSTTGFYITQLEKARERYPELLSAGHIVVAGDFNQNYRLDRPGFGTFAALVEDLREYRVTSMYHLARGCAQGEEPEPTFFMHHDMEKPHHIDYVFASADLSTQGVQVDVGAYADWGALSDHMPLSCTFGTEGKEEAVESVTSTRRP